MCKKINREIISIHEKNSIFKKTRHCLCLPQRLKSTVSNFMYLLDGFEGLKEQGAVRIALAFEEIITKTFEIAYFPQIIENSVMQLLQKRKWLILQDH